MEGRRAIQRFSPLRPCGAMNRTACPATAPRRQTLLPAEVQKASVALNHIEPDAPLKLAEVHRTQVQRPGVGFGQVVGSVHQAVEPDAVLVLPREVALVNCNGSEMEDGIWY